MFEIIGKPARAKTCEAIQGLSLLGQTLEEEKKADALLTKAAQEQRATGKAKAA